MNNLIQKLVSIKRTRNQQKYYLQIRKLYRTRKYIINEIVNTEKKYLDDLKIIKELLVDNFKRFNKAEDTHRVFCNLEEIIAVNQALFDKLQYRIDKANQDYTRNYKIKLDETKLLGHENSVLFFQNENSDFLRNFESYFEYCERYDSTCKYRNELKKSDESFKLLIADAQRDPKLQQMDIEDFLVKPIQRLPKYILLLKDLKKNTPNIQYFNQICYMKEFVHPDYDNICKYLAKFEEINEKNNEKIGVFQNNQKMKEIQSQYGSPSLQIHNNIRQFIFEDNVEYYISAKNKKNVHLICLNDHLLIVEIDYSAFQGAKKKVISFTEFSLGSEVNVIESQKGLLFKVTTKNKVFIFVASDIKQLNSLKSQLTDTFQKFLAQKKKQLSDSGQQQVSSWDQLQLIVSVEGTEEYNIASLQNFTVYIIKFSLEGVEWKVYLRYKEIKDIRDEIIKKEASADIVKLQTSNWLRNHDNKYLDSVKINVEGFIQSIFQWKKLSENDNAQKILTKLGLPLNFHLLPKVVGNTNEASKFTKSLSFSENEDSVSQVAEKLEQKLKEELQLEKLLKEHIQQDPKKSKRVRIYFPLPLIDQFKEKQVKIKIEKLKINEEDRVHVTTTVNELMKAMELCEIIADSIDLKMFFDFRLIVVSSRGNRRCLDHDQIVLQSLPKDNNILPDVSGFLRVFDETYSLEFTKYIYFPHKIELALYKSDISRLYFLCEILFTEARNFGLSNQDYSLIYALYILIYDKKQCKQLQDLHRLVHKDIIKTWQDSTWKKNTENHLNALTPKLESIASQNQKLRATNEDISTDQSKIFSNETLLARVMAMNKAFKLDLFGLITFYVGINLRDEKNLNLHKLMDGDLPNLYLGVRYNAVLLLSPGKKKVIHTLNINQIESIKVEPIYLYITVTNVDKTFDFPLYFLKLKTLESFKISQLIKFYMEINSLYRQLE